MEIYRDEILIKDNKILNIDDLQELKSFLVKIKIGGGTGSGFLYLVKDNNGAKIPVLVTCNHIIDLDHLNKGK